MSINVVCDCGREYNLPASASGRRFRCKDCDEVLVARRKRKRRRSRDDDFEDDFDEEDDWDDEPRRRRRGGRGGGRRGSSRGRSSRRSRDSLEGGLAVLANIVRWAGLVLGAIGLAAGMTLLFADLGGGPLVACLLCGGVCLTGGILAGLAVSETSTAERGSRAALVYVGASLTFGSLLLFLVLLVAAGE